MLENEQTNEKKQTKSKAVHFILFLLFLCVKAKSHFSLCSGSFCVIEEFYHGKSKAVKQKGALNAQW